MICAICTQVSQSLKAKRPHLCPQGAASVWGSFALGLSLFNAGACCSFDLECFMYLDFFFHFRNYMSLDNFTRLQCTLAIFTPLPCHPCQPSSLQVHVPVYSRFCASMRSQGHLCALGSGNYLWESAWLSNWVHI